MIVKCLWITIILLFSILMCSAQASQGPLINPWQQWTFTGSVMDEKGEAYYYYFVFQQHAGQRMVDILVLSDQLNEIIRYSETSEKESDRFVKMNAWELGRSFFRFNPITKSWVFGLKTKEDIGFDFKADIRPVDGDMGERQLVSEGLKVEMNQFQQLNGYVFFTKKDQEVFVSAQRGWLRYIEGKQPPIMLNSLMCVQKDGAGLYSYQYESAYAKKAAIVGRRNAKGERENVSQFINIEALSNNEWEVDIKSPKIKWSLKEVANFVNKPFETFIITGLEQLMPGICYYQTRRPYKKI